MLLHFTKSFESLASIAAHGFLFLHNETGVIRQAIFRAYDIAEADCQSDGMVCFTELTPEGSFSHQAKYGQFGLGVSKEWLISNGAQKVQYVEIGQDSFKSLVADLKRLAPQAINGVALSEFLANSETRFTGMLTLTSVKWALQAGASDEYIKLLRELEYTQIDKDKAEEEWRIRNPRPYCFVGDLGRKEQVDLLVNCISDPNVQNEINGLMYYTINCKHQLALTGKLSLVLQLPKEQIRAIFCPSSYQSIIREALDRDGLSHIPIFLSDVP